MKLCGHNSMRCGCPVTKCEDWDSWYIMNPFVVMDLLKATLTAAGWQVDYACRVWLATSMQMKFQSFEGKRMMSQFQIMLMKDVVTAKIYTIRKFPACIAVISWVCGSLLNVELNIQP